MKRIFISVLLVMLALSAFAQDTDAKDDHSKAMEAWEKALTRERPSEEEIAAEYAKFEGGWEFFVDGVSQGIRSFTGMTGHLQKLFVKGDLEGHFFDGHDLNYRLAWPCTTQADRMTIVLKEEGLGRVNLKYFFIDEDTMIWAALDEDHVYFGKELVFKRKK